jgi:hypothetical protein
MIEGMYSYLRAFGRGLAREQELAGMQELERDGSGQAPAKACEYSADVGRRPVLVVGRFSPCGA